MRLQVVGVSSSVHCGVRRHAEMLSSQLREQGLDIVSTWGELSKDGLSIEPWLREVETTAAAALPDAQLWHYSVFTLSHRGVPFRVPAIAWRIRNCRGRLIVVLHEFAYPWRRRGMRGAILAATQRAALIAVLWASDGAIATTATRVAWLQSRRWLPRRPVQLAPVFSTVPVDATGARSVDGMIVVFGYGAEGVAAEVIVAAVAEVRRRVDVHLVLLGAPGADDPVSHRWQAVATDQSVPLRFTGPVADNEISNTLKQAAVCIIPDAEGLSSRRTTAAAVLAHGCAAVSFAGPEAWRDAAIAGAVVEVPMRSGALAEQLMVLLADNASRRALGQRAAAFYDQSVGPSHVARSVNEMLRCLEGSTSV